MTRQLVGGGGVRDTARFLPSSCELVVAMRTLLWARLPLPETCQPGTSKARGLSRQHLFAQGSDL